MPFRVVVLPRAERDIENAISWLEERSSAAAERWRLGLLAIVEKLEIDPVRYPLADESADLGVEIRECQYGKGRATYKILFSIDGNSIYVLRVRHSAQDRLTGEELA